MIDIEERHREALSIISAHVASLEQLAVQHVAAAREAGFLAGYERAVSDLRRMNDAERAQVADGSVR